MATLKEEFELMKLKIAAGKGSEVVHIVWVDQERRARKSPGHKTRFTFDLLSNELYRETWAEWDRILTQIVNVTMARQIVGEYLRDCLRALTTDRIKALLAEGEVAAPKPPKAEIPELPEWMKR